MSIKDESRLRMVSYLEKIGYIKNESVKNAFLKVDRSMFVPEASKDEAYKDTPLSIGWGQTISAPSMIALMLEVSDLKLGTKTLEIGAGSCYNAALIAEICGEENVVTIERIPEVYQFGINNLKSAGYNITVVLGDGTKGYQEGAPYDRIIATAAAPKIPQSWKDQLKEEGMIVAPVGKEKYYQELLVSKKRKDGTFETKKHCGCVFVPLVGEDGWKE
ncbi:MAG TPA: protein-L-isoaspartate(D-aspartate) O-methyltransferase [Methanofastidiosum sp.]|jgi:protein-L-isoaspartate(D-aspartate) O-methyltransferase|nr:protein-L-isoaspartate(D-aspartate) O-methyltransferase [Methanofastidiosum sp.]HOE93587.1 protein-L-isoaspartate(D-aspartate) O-methyltransferase [Methanofastidiosum sp.]HOR88747.1 protein-L-isoaspartate(D-aspartate) O-methyltransferase [Methanofastidiosum sp.]HPL01184.1 protein-L-isoaspartate(D-aspartate) O-methyltransferase [Methanofastidiosum sp.]HPX24986.1 protein-L-isoaspartate(D-aspartate) O-methyltransferase [Methanofastidiosum sp.]